jgi:hypothetical protein
VVHHDDCGNSNRGRDRIRGAASANAQRRGCSGRQGRDRPPVSHGALRSIGRPNRQKNAPFTRAATGAASPWSRSHFHGSDSVFSRNDRWFSNLLYCRDKRFRRRGRTSLEFDRDCICSSGLYSRIFGFSDAQCRRPSLVDSLLCSSFTRIGFVAKGTVMDNHSHHLPAHDIWRCDRRDWIYFAAIYWVRLHRFAWRANFRGHSNRSWGLWLQSIATRHLSTRPPELPVSLYDTCLVLCIRNLRKHDLAARRAHHPDGSCSDRAVAEGPRSFRLSA